MELRPENCRSQGTFPATCFGVESRAVSASAQHPYAAPGQRTFAAMSGSHRGIRPLASQ